MELPRLSRYKLHAQRPRPRSSRAGKWKGVRVSFGILLLNTCGIGVHSLFLNIFRTHEVSKQEDNTIWLEGEIHLVNDTIKWLTLVYAVCLSVCRFLCVFVGVLCFSGTLVYGRIAFFYPIPYDV